MVTISGGVLVAAKYGELGAGQSTLDVCRPHGQSLERNWSTGWEEIKFWYNEWCGDWALREVYPDLYPIVEDKEAAVSSLLCSRGQDMMFYCFVRFVCNFHDWKLEDVESLMDSLYY